MAPTERVLDGGRPRVFVSAPVDKNLEPWQKKVKAKIVDAVKGAGFEPQMFGVAGLPVKMAWNFDNVVKVLSRCRGAVIIGLARERFEVDDKTIALSSEYNHYEGAAAHALGLPLLILAEEGLASDRGILDRGGQYIVSIPQNAKATWTSKSTDFTTHFNDWKASISAQKDVFFGYSSDAKTVASTIMNYLTHELDLTVEDWAMDFKAGETILARLTEAAEKCETGLFLLTKDDDVLQGSEKVASPRDNVIFEAGFFLQAKGPKRVLIIREKETKMPADLGGTIYVLLKNRDEIATIHDQLRKFFKAALT